MSTSKEIHPTEAACKSLEDWFLRDIGKVPPQVAAKLAIIREAIPKPVRVRNWLEVSEDCFGSCVIVKSKNHENGYGPEVIEISRCESDSYDTVGTGIFFGVENNNNLCSISLSRDEAERVEVIRDALTAWLESPDAFETFAKGLA